VGYGVELGKHSCGTLNQEADSETMKRLKAHHELRMACISVTIAVLFGHGGAQSAPLSDGGVVSVANPPPAVQLEALTAQATRLLQKQYGFCITNRSAPIFELCTSFVYHGLA